jgi:hypothetical protein
MGVLSALPIVAAGNACCCLWVVSGGVIAAYLFQQNHSAPMTPADGALVGLLAGLIGAFVQFVVAIPVTILIGPMEREMLRRILEGAGSMPPQMRDAFDRYSTGNREFGGLGLMIAGRIFFLMMALCIGAMFSTIGGLIGAMVFRQDAPPGFADAPNAG